MIFLFKKKTGYLLLSYIRQNPFFKKERPMRFIACFASNKCYLYIFRSVTFHFSTFSSYFLNQMPSSIFPLVKFIFCFMFGGSYTDKYVPLKMLHPQFNFESRYIKVERCNLNYLSSSTFS